MVWFFNCVITRSLAHTKGNPHIEFQFLARFVSRNFILYFIFCDRFPHQNSCLFSYFLLFFWTQSEIFQTIYFFSLSFVLHRYSEMVESRC